MEGRFNKIRIYSLRIGREGQIERGSEENNIEGDIYNKKNNIEDGIEGGIE